MLVSFAQESKKKTLSLHLHLMTGKAAWGKPDFAIAGGADGAVRS